MLPFLLSETALGKEVLLGWSHVIIKADFASQKCPIKMSLEVYSLVRNILTD